MTTTIALAMALFGMLFLVRGVIRASRSDGSAIAVDSRSRVRDVLEDPRGGGSLYVTVETRVARVGYERSTDCFWLFDVQNWEAPDDRSRITTEERSAIFAVIEEWAAAHGRVVELPSGARDSVSDRGAEAAPDESPRR